MIRLPGEGRVRVRVQLFVALLVCVSAMALVPSAGLAGTAFSPTPLEIGVLTTGTLGADPTGVHTSFYTLHLDAGQTLAATYTPAASMIQPALVILPPSSHNPGRHPLSKNLELERPLRPTTIHAVAPWTGTYTLVVAGMSADATYSIETSIVPPLPYSLASMDAPSWIVKNHWFKLSTTLRGEFADMVNPMRFVIQRKVGSSWTTFRTLAPAFDPQRAEYDVSNPFWASIRLPKGTFRVRASFSDAAHPTAIADEWKTIRVDTPVPRATVAELVRPSSATTVTALVTRDLVVGYGSAVKKGSRVTVDYAAWLTDGTQFDTTVGKSSFTFAIGHGELIQGWERGLLGMKRGGIRQLVVPARLAYGSAGQPPVIPPNATVCYTVKVLDVK